MTGLLLLLSPSATAGLAAAERAMEALKVSDAPRIDGSLADAAWRRAAVISDFRQKEPAEGELATEQTRVRIIYDEARLYVGVELLDTNPALIQATELRRDNTLEADDSFAVLLDTFHDHRNGFVFRVNPRGTRFDGLIRNESRFVSSDWDEQWTTAATITERGWAAELSIPFKILRFTGASEQVWGVNFERVIKRKNELVYWSGWDRNYGFHHVSQAGQLSGLVDIRQAERLRFRPYLVTGAEKLDAVATPTGAGMIGEIGIDDFKFAVTSNLTADVAVNPDFAQTEVDRQRVNLTRFSLFFPEKRQFFIEGADSLRMGVGLLHFGPPPLELFYSRRVGLSERGEPIPIVAGGKLTGKVRGFDLGLLNVQTDDVTSLTGENFAVGRLRKEVFGRSYIGGIVTNREGGGVYNRTAVADARFVLKEHLNIGALFGRSFDPGVSEKQWVRHAGAEWRADLLAAGATYLEIDPNFTPGIGFVRRRERLLGTRVSLKPRPRSDLIRQFEFTPSTAYFHDADRILRTRQTRFQFAAAFESGDRLELSLENRFEHLPRSFPIGPGVTLPVDRYEWNAAGLTFTAFNGRTLSGRIRVEAGDFYSGTKRSLELQGEIRPNENVSFNPSYNFNDVNLREGVFDTHLVGLRANVSFTTNFLTAAFIQYNSSGDLAAVQLRLNYIFRTIDNVYLVFDETRFTDGVFANDSNRSLVLKFTYSVHR